MSQYVIPHVVSIYSDNIDHDFKNKIKMTIVLNTSEYIGHTDNIKELLTKRIRSFERRRTIYGYIINVYDILDISRGRLLENANISYDVIVLCKVINIKPGSILVGAKLLNITDIGFEFEYNDISILVEYTDIDKKNFIIGSLHNIFVKNIVKTLDLANYTIKYTIKQGTYNRRQTIFVKTIETIDIVYNKWINKKIYEVDDYLIAYDYNDIEIKIHAGDIIDIIKHYQIYTNGVLYTKYLFHEDLLKGCYPTHDTKTPELSVKYSDLDNRSTKYISILHKHVKDVLYSKDLDYTDKWINKVIPNIKSTENKDTKQIILDMFNYKDAKIYEGTNTQLVKDTYSKVNYDSVYIDIGSLLVSVIAASIISNNCIIKTSLLELDSDITHQLLYLYGSMYNIIYIYKSVYSSYESDEIYVIFQDKKETKIKVSTHTNILENILKGKYITNLIETQVSQLFTGHISDIINMIKHYDFQVHLYGYEILNRYKY